MSPSPNPPLSAEPLTDFELKNTRQALDCGAYGFGESRAQMLRLLATISDLQGRLREWQPYETAPKDGKPFLFWEAHNKIVVIGWWQNEQDGWFTQGYPPGSQPPASWTRWQPLPSPPPGAMTVDKTVPTLPSQEPAHTGYENFGMCDGPTLLKMCGDSGERWAEAFMEKIVDKGITIDAGLMIGWFANAIEHSNDVRRWERERAEREARPLPSTPAASVPQQGVDALRWQPIETAPMDGRDILITSAGIGMLVRIAFWDEARGGCWSIWPGREQAMKPTHWMPLPPPPTPTAAPSISPSTPPSQVTDKTEAR